jgi:hypothetical protein
MTMQTIQVQVRDLRGTRSLAFGLFGLSPASSIPISRIDVVRQHAITDRHREMQRIAWTRDLPLWMLTPCFQDQIPTECLLGLDACHEAKFCLGKRLAEFTKRVRCNG